MNKKDLKVMTESELKEFNDLQLYFGNNRENLIKIGRYTALANLLATEDCEGIEEIRKSAFTALRYFRY